MRSLWAAAGLMLGWLIPSAIRLVAAAPAAGVRDGVAWLCNAVLPDGRSATALAAGVGVLATAGLWCMVAEAFRGGRDARRAGVLVLAAVAILLLPSTAPVSATMILLAAAALLGAAPGAWAVAPATFGTAAYLAIAVHDAAGPRLFTTDAAAALAATVGGVPAMWAFTLSWMVVGAGLCALSLLHSGQTLRRKANAQR